MSENSAIEWTDHTFNPWMGCTKVSPGCLHCYAEKLDKRHLRSKEDHWGKGVPRLAASEAMWREPLRWARHIGFRECQACGFRGEMMTGCHACGSIELERARPRVFCASLADWLDEEVPVEWLVRLLTTIFQTPQLDWLLLTKRPENWGERLHAALRAAVDPGLVFEVWLSQWLDGDVPANVWIGTSVEDQARADERIPRLLEIPAKVRFLSCEPLLGEVDISSGTYSSNGRGLVWDAFGKPAHIPNCDFPDGNAPDGPAIHWVICGGESGQGARPMHPDWARGLRDQCSAAQVAFFFKQWGEWMGYFQPADADEVVRACLDNPQGRWVGPDGETTHKGWNTVWMNRVGKKAAGRLLDGREHNGMPQPHLRVVGSRDFGEAVVVRDERDGSEQIVRRDDLPGGMAQ